MHALKMTMLVCALCVPTACGGGGDKDKSSGSDSGDDGKKKKKKKKKSGDDEKKKKKKKKKAEMNVKGKLGGKDVAFTHAVVADRGNDEMYLHLATHPIDCEKLSVGFVRVEDGGTGAAVHLAHHLQPDGKLKWVVKSGSFEAPGDKKGRKLEDGATVTKVEGTSDKEVVADVALTVSDKEGEKFEIAGTVVAKGCGSKPFSSKKADPRPQKNVEVTVSGHKFEINSAIFRKAKNGDVTVELMSSPGKCEGYWSAGNFGIDLRLDKSGKQIRYAYFRGANMASDYNASHDPIGSVDVGAKKGDTVPVKIDYQRKSFDFDVKVKGDVEAIECIDKK